MRLLINAQHPSIRMLRLHRIPPHITVILVRNKRPRTQRRRAHHRQQRRLHCLRIRRLLHPLELLHLILPLRARPRPLIHRTLMGNRVRRRIHHQLTPMPNQQMLTIGHLTDLRARHIPMRTNLPEPRHILRPHNRTHALLRLGRQNLRSQHILGPQRHRIQIDLHAPIAGGGQLRCGTRQPCAPQILNAHNHPGAVQIQAALNQHLFCKRVPHLHRRQFPLRPLLKRVRGQHRHPTNAVKPSPGAKKHHLIAQAGGKRQLQIIHLERAHAQRIHQWVARIGFVEHGFATNIRQAQTVTVMRNTINHPRQHPGRVRRVRGAEPQLVHHRNRPSPHGHDVAHNTAHTSGRTLVRLHIGGVVMGFHPERDRIAPTNVHHAGVLPNAGQDFLAHFLGHSFPEIPQVHFRRFIRTMLGPHDGIHG